MYEVSVKTHFSAAHHLRDYPGPCATPHGHNWDVEVSVEGEVLNAAGILVDFREVKKAVADVLGSVDHQDLNRVEAFHSRNPTSENIAKHLFDELGRRLNAGSCRVCRVRVGETPGSSACYSERLP